MPRSLARPPRRPARARGRVAAGRPARRWRRPRATGAAGRCRRPPSRCARAAGWRCPWLRGERCPRCGLPGRCGGGCPLAGGAVERAWAPVAYEGPARALVHALKFRGALRLADLMAAQIAAGAPPELLAAPVALVPVPTHPAPGAQARLRSRGAAGGRAVGADRAPGARVRDAQRPGHAAGGRRDASERRASGRIAMQARGPVPHAGAARRRRAHDRSDARGLRTGPAPGGRAPGPSGHLRALVEGVRTRG